jgi:NADH-quinone oxidoreductase subunit G
MIAEVPALGIENAIVPMAWNPPALPAKASGPVAYPITDFYMTNAICRASPTMQRCSAEITHGQDFAEAAE